MPLNYKKLLLDFSSNRVIWLLTFNDVFNWGVYFVVTVLSGLYLSQKFGQTTVQYIGIGTAITFLSRAAFQMPIGYLTDKLKRDLDEIIFLSLSSVITGFSVILYYFILSPVFYYYLQFIFGLGAAMNLCSWRKLFAKNVDKDKVGFEYSRYDMVLSISIAVFSVVAGMLANINYQYFGWVILAIGVVMMLSSLWALAIVMVKDRKSKNS